MFKYTANREIKDIKRTGEVIVYKNGDLIPDFESWDLMSQRSHLNLEWVTKKSASMAPKESLPAKKNKQKKRGKHPVGK
jgi:hypothetical protein